MSVLRSKSGPPAYGPLHPTNGLVCRDGRGPCCPLHAARFSCLSLSLYQIKVGWYLCPFVLFPWPIACACMPEDVLHYYCILSCTLLNCSLSLTFTSFSSCWPGLDRSLDVMSILVSVALFYTVIKHSVIIPARGCPGSPCISPVWLERCKLSLSLSLLPRGTLPTTLLTSGPAPTYQNVSAPAPGWQRCATTAPLPPPLPPLLPLLPPLPPLPPPLYSPSPPPGPHRPPPPPQLRPPPAPPRHHRAPVAPHGAGRAGERPGPGRPGWVYWRRAAGAGAERAALGRAGCVGSSKRWMEGGERHMPGRAPQRA